MIPKFYLLFLTALSSELVLSSNAQDFWKKYWTYSHVQHPPNYRSKTGGQRPLSSPSPQGTKEPTNGFWARAIIDWGPLPTNGAEHLRIWYIGINIKIFTSLWGCHLNTWEFMSKTVQFNSVLPSKPQLTWNRSDQRPNLILSIGGCWGLATVT